MIEALSSSETPVLTTATRRNIPKDGTLHSHRRENLNSYMKNIYEKRGKEKTTEKERKAAVQPKTAAMQSEPIM
jgi:hypothetical protein